ncbi:putative CDPK-related kinase 3 [Iris pallida]|uniref:CDPK-related kinase 3 n=1 Tax=Iris pallida TaxID=29817 RepID=A0AAX6GWD3_IRIPA|nr:putative CDPK-related kinase 3 [Iris pallida]
MEDDAKVIVTRIPSVVSFCHLQGVVHRDLKQEACNMNSPINGFSMNDGFVKLRVSVSMVCEAASFGCDMVCEAAGFR